MGLHGWGNLYISTHQSQKGKRISLKGVGSNHWFQFKIFKSMNSVMAQQT